MRQIQERHRLFIQAGHFAVARHSHHREPFVRQVRVHLLSDSLLTRPVAINKCFAHNRHALRTHVVLHGEVAPLHQRNFHRLEIIRRDHGRLRLHGFVGLRHVALRLHARRPAESQRHAARKRHRLYPRHRFQSRLQLAVERRASFVRISRGKHIVGSDQHVMRIESRINLLRAQKAAYEQSRANQQQQ